MTEQSGLQLSGSAPAMYERYIVPALSAAFAQELVTLTALTTGERLLDVACGSGVVTRQAAQAVGPPGEVSGLDVHAGMLRMARTLPSPAGVSIAYREGSVMALPFPTATFDVVLCQNGLEFFPDCRRSLQEIRRVLTPAGRLGLRVWRALEHQTFHRVVFAALDRHLWGGQDVPSRLSAFQPFGLWNAEELRAFVGDAGFRDIGVRVSRGPRGGASGSTPTDVASSALLIPAARTCAVKVIPETRGEKPRRQAYCGFGVVAIEAADRILRQRSAGRSRFKIKEPGKLATTGV